MPCKICIVSAILIAPITLLAAKADQKPAATQASAAPQVWTVDDTHSMALFRVQHMGAGMFWGRFDGVTGTITTTGTQGAAPLFPAPANTPATAAVTLTASQTLTGKGSSGSLASMRCTQVLSIRSGRLLESTVAGTSQAH